MNIFGISEVEMIVINRERRKREINSTFSNKVTLFITHFRTHSKTTNMHYRVSFGK